MKLPLPKNINAHILLTRAGYHHFRDPRTQKESYVMRAGSGFYPRYHLYIHTAAEGYIFDLHIDMKKPTYEGMSAHSGEYSGQRVEEEMERLKQWAQYFLSHPNG